MASHAPQQSRGGRAAPSDRQPPVGSSRPHPWELVLHPIKALHFIAALAGDRRISGLRKLLYIGPLLILLIAVLLPEGIVAGAVAVLLPVVGPLVDLPADVALECWASSRSALSTSTMRGSFTRAGRSPHPQPLPQRERGARAEAGEAMEG